MQILNFDIQFQYVQGNCHDRAHLMSLFLKSIGIVGAKIWAFAPCVYSVDNNTMISIRDKNKISLSERIDWRYHVALVVFVDNGIEIEPQVIDPSLFPNGPVYYRTWLVKLKTEKILHLFTDYEWYLFNSWFPFPELEVLEEIEMPEPNIKLPDWFPKEVITDFFKYEKECKENFWLEKGLAINDTAYLFYETHIKLILDSETELLHDYRKMVGDVFNFETIFRDYTFNDEMDEEFQHKHQKIITLYRKKYDLYFEKWKIKLNTFV